MMIRVCGMLYIVILCYVEVYRIHAEEQTIASNCSVRMDLVVAIDASGSVGQDNFQSCLDFVNEIISAANIDSGDVRVGILIYSTNPKVEFHLNKYSNKAELQEAILKIYYTGGNTYIGKAIEQLRNMFVERNGDRAGVENVAFVMTDGVSQDSTTAPAEAARSEGITIYAFGIGSDASRENLKDIASKPAHEYLHIVDSFSELNGLGDDLFKKMCLGITVNVNTTTIQPLSTTSNEITTETEMVDKSTDMTSDVTTTFTSSSVGNRKKCVCPCHMLGDARYVNMTSSELQSTLEANKRLLLRDKRKLALWKRKFYSVDDKRYSVTALGVSVVVVFLGIPLTLVCLIDLDKKYFRFTAVK